MSELYRVRDPQPSDMPFIKNTWRESLLRDSPQARGADPRLLNKEIEFVASVLFPSGVGSEIFARANLRVACDKVDPDIVLGFACWQGPALHYCYVNHSLTGHGMLPALLEGAEIDRYTFRTAAFEKRVRQKRLDLKFAPRFTLGSY